MPSSAKFHYRLFHYQQTLIQALDFDKALDLAKEKFRLNQYALSITYCKQCLKFQDITDFQKYEVYKLAGRASQSLERFNDALIYFTEALILNPNNLQLRNNRAVAYANLNIMDGAINDFDSILGNDARANLTNDELSAIYNNRGLAKQEQGLLVDAIRDFDEASRLDPQSGASANCLQISKEELIDCIMRLNDLDEKRNLLNECLNPETALGKRILVKSFFDFFKSDGIEKYVRNQIEILNDPEAYVQRQHELAQLGNHINAIIYDRESPPYEGIELKPF